MFGGFWRDNGKYRDDARTKGAEHAVQHKMHGAIGQYAEVGRKLYRLSIGKKLKKEVT